MRNPFLIMATLVTLLSAGCVSPGASNTAIGPAVTATAPREVQVGVLLGLSGPQADGARAVLAGVEVACDDANHYLQEQNAPLRLVPVIEDAAGDPLAGLQALDARGIKVVIGPYSSEDLSLIRGYAESHGMVLVSPSSTAPSLALEDLVVRTAPLDVLQARAIAMIMQDRGIQTMVTLYRDDTWGQELARELGLAGEIFSLSLDASQSYPPASTQYSAPVASLSVAVAEAIAQVGTSSVGVVLLSFAEAREVFEAASVDPGLRAVRWFGCDGNALQSAIADEATASAFAAQTRFTAASFLNPFDAGNPQATLSAFVPPFETLKDRIRARLGHQPTEYAYTGYDSLWLLALAARRLEGFPAPTLLVKALWQEAAGFRGASGEMALTPTFDRTRGDFGFFQVQGSGWIRRAVLHDARSATASVQQLTYESGEF